MWDDHIRWSWPVRRRHGSVRTWRSRNTNGLYQCAMHKCILYVRFMKDKKNMPKLGLVVMVV